MLQVLCDLHIVHEQESKILKYINCVLLHLNV